MGSDDFHKFVQADSSVVTYRDFCVDCGRHRNAPCHSRTACPSTNERAARSAFGASRPARSVNAQRAEILRLARIRAGLNLREAAELLMMSSRLLGDIEFARAECDAAQADLMLCVYLPYEERQ